MLEMSISSYYYKPKIDPIKRAISDTDLRGKIETLQMEFPRYGYRRVREHLKREGLIVNWKRIRRVMREYGLFAEFKKAFKTVTTDSNHPHRIYPNLTKGMAITKPNQVWASDITYIRISTCFVYLAVILDLYSRKVVGWACGQTHEERTVHRGFENGDSRKTTGRRLYSSLRSRRAVRQR
jgi:putative transposase